MNLKKFINLMWRGNNLQVKSMSLGPLGTNCYIVSHDHEAIIFDPSGEAEKIISYLEDSNLKPLAILLTHAHFDHIGALDEVRKHYDIDVYLHEAEADWLVDPELNRSSLYFPESNWIQTELPEKQVDEGTLSIGPFKMDVVHTPGHSPGSVTYIFHEQEFIVSGDVLFRLGIGRTDLPGGSIEQLAKSIVHHLYSLPDQFKVFAGHNIQTTIGTEKHENPYTRQFYKA